MQPQFRLSRTTRQKVTFAAGARWLSSSASLHCAFVYLGVTLPLLAIALHLTAGRIVYAVDDAYIHLELARNIAHGHYGINPGEFTSPSSSIIWPFLLVLGAGTRWQVWLPFVLNVICAGTAAVVVGRIVDLHSWRSEGRGWWGKRLLVCALAIFVSNLVGLTFLGMEHSLQLLLTILAARGLLEALNGRKIAMSCLIATASGPAVRYENLAIVFAVAVALLVQRRRRAAIWMSAASMVVPTIFSAFLLAHGVRPLPNSIVSKAQTGMLHSRASFHLLTVVRWNLQSVPWLRFAPVLIVVAAIAWRAPKKQAAIIWGVVGTLLLHSAFGRFGENDRYEVYAVALAAIIVLWSVSSIRVPWHYAALGMTYFALPYIAATFHSPLNCFGVYVQEYQMSRFMRDDYGGNIAVEDLGLASYRRAQGVYVLDLEGLGSNEILDSGYQDPVVLENLAHEHTVGLTTQWPYTPLLPASWRPVAVITSIDGALDPSIDHAIFYVTADGNLPQIQAELSQFREALPGGAVLRMLDPTCKDHSSFECGGTRPPHRREFTTKIRDFLWNNPPS